MEVRPVEIPQVCPPEVLGFSEQTEVGGMFEGIEAENAAAYFSGYIASRVSKFHLQRLKTSITDCTECQHILISRADKDLSVHLFVSFKEYREEVDNNFGFKYCSKSFIKCIIQLERVFLFYFENYRHLIKFTYVVEKFIRAHCVLPGFCCADVLNFLVSFYVRCRTLQSCKILNRQLPRKDCSEKVKKITHQ